MDEAKTAPHQSGVSKPGGRKANRVAGSIVRKSQGELRRCYSETGLQWTEEGEQRFLDELAASGNIGHSCEAAGVHSSTAYRQRRLRNDFAAKWDGALDQAATRIIFELAKTAEDSLTVTEFDTSRPIPRMTVDEVLRVLAFCQKVREGGRGGGPLPRLREMEELRDSILEKVRAVRRANKRR